MSLILEALRKSEAERRRGLPPDLHAELPPTPLPRARAVPARWWATAAFASLALLAWWLLRTPDARVDAPSPRAARNAPDASAPAMPRTDNTALPAVTPSPDAAVAPVPTSAATTPTAAPEPVQDLPSDGAQVDATAPSSPAPQAPTAAAAAPVPAASTAPPASDRPLSLAELDPGARDALPPLRMSMHLWNETPALRFAIIDGQRVSEGDTVGDVRVARIERDGVVLQWQGRAIHLPVR